MSANQSPVNLPLTRRTGLRAALGPVLLALLLTACGGAKNEDAASGPTYEAPTGTDAPASREAAARFLAQASFGPDAASVQRVMSLGYSRWIEEQWRQSVSNHQATWEEVDAAAKAADPTNPNARASQDALVNSFWRSAVVGNDQLRQRVAFALSQIFVISMLDANVGDNPRAAANYYDMLARTGLTTYRELLEAVSLHPMMGRYLTSLGNRKADPRTGRVPDENYAREVMQLLSIGLEELNLDGTPKMANGAPIPTYGPSDIAGLARVFTGWSWACPVAPTANNSTCFGSGSTNINGTSTSDPDRQFKRMINYPQNHAPEAKQFLTANIPAGTSGTASLKTALDTLAEHPNVGPFIGKQLIQRLVTSNPSPAYVRAVAQVFNNNGQGVRGDMKAVVKAILTHAEARNPSATGGKVREPVLRFAAVLRAFKFNSDSGRYKVGVTDNPGTQLGQTMLRSPSVFNFYRPGYVPPGSRTATAGLVSPELQIAHETTAAGYVNFMRNGVSGGFGNYAGTPLNRNDIQPDFTAQLALADDAGKLVDDVNARLMHGSMPAALKTLIVDAVSTITIPGSNATQIANAKRNRVNAAILLTLVSPEYQVQK